MAVHGLFIGIDRYQSPQINWLNSASRDAVGLHALFTDNFGGNLTLLTDQQATKAAIESEFQRLATCSEDDVVIVLYSGHGSETHEIVTYDADLSDLSGSCIPLDQLTAWFSLIPAKRVICLLDCCFSGGAGAKVLHVEAKPKGLKSTESLLDQLSGEGRLIFTASSATEEAWEHSRYGHGLLSHFFMQALLGVEEVIEQGKLPLYKLLHYVTQRVTDAAATFGKPQHPTLKGRIDEEIVWPVFTLGLAYMAAFPAQGPHLATAELQSLADFGFPHQLLTAWGGAIPGLNPLQVTAINDYHLLQGDHLVVSAPTSSGKTMVGELAALYGTLERKRAFFLLPLRALVNDKYAAFQKLYGPFGIRTIRATGEISDDIPSLMKGQYDICLLTYEKFTALILSNPYLLNQVGTIVVDEVQMIADQSRGVNLEFVLTLLRMRRRHDIEPQLIALSAVIGDTAGLERWLGARLLKRTERPVPLDEGILCANGRFRYLDGNTGEEKTEPNYIRRQFLKESSQDWVIPLVKRLVSEGKQVIVFRETKSEARWCANYLANSLGLPPAEEALAELPSGDSSRASEFLRQVLSGGVAFHISDLDPAERSVVEQRFRAPNSGIRVVAATTTLAMGINMPAAAVVVVGLMHPQDNPYSVAEYKNIVGRAGRLGMAERGSSYLIATSEIEEYRHWSAYIMGQPEDLHSQFVVGGDARSLIVRVLAAVTRISGQGLSEDEIVEFLESSFGAFQQSLKRTGWEWDRGSINSGLKDLILHKLVENTHDGFYTLTELGKLAGESGVEVASIVRAVDVFSSLAPVDITDPALLTVVQLSEELDAVLFPANKKSTLKEPQAWSSALRQQGISPGLLTTLQRTAKTPVDAMLRTKKAAAALMWISGLPLSDIETTLTQFDRGDSAAGPLRALKSRMCDILPTISRIAELLHPTLRLGERTQKLLVRLETGVPGSVVKIASALGSDLTRADYLLLVNAGLKTPEEICAATDQMLLPCLNGNPEKLRSVREAATRLIAESNDTSPPIALPAYEE